MTFLSYALPKGAPQKQVWYATCDVCRVATSGPYGNGANQQQNMRLDIEDRGWRYQREHPMDTCPDCLAHRSSDSQVPAGVSIAGPTTTATAPAGHESPDQDQQDRSTT